MVTQVKHPVVRGATSSGGVIEEEAPEMLDVYEETVWQERLIHQGIPIKIHGEELRPNPVCSIKSIVAYISHTRVPFNWSKQACGIRSYDPMVCRDNLATSSSGKLGVSLVGKVV
jgi:hypothetical protein